MTPEESGGLWNANGQIVVPFPRELVRGGNFVLLKPQPVLGGPRDDLAFVMGKEIWIYTRDKEYPVGDKIYAPIRERNRQNMDVSIPNWVKE